MLLAGLVFGLILVMRGFPETPFARLLHFYLVEKPLLWAATVERAHVIFVCFILLVLSAGGEAIALVGAPHLFFAFAWDLSLYLDALAVTYLLAAASQLKTMFHVLKSKLSLRRGRPLRRTARAGRRRAARTKPMRKPGANDDEPAPAFTIAA